MSRSFSGRAACAFFMAALLAGSSLFAPAFSGAWAASADSDIMPPPRKSPRIPVQEEKIPGQREALTGNAISLDGSDLRINSTDLRLFGILTPQLTSPLGPQARLALDKLLSEHAVTCHVRDRDRDGRLLATCLTDDNIDLALGMLESGYATSARAALQNTDLADRYTAAEQKAMQANRGVWSTGAAAPAPAAAEAPAAKADIPVAAAAPALATPDALPTPVELSAPPERPGFVERYQILLAAFVLLGAGFFMFLSVLKARGIAMVQMEISRRHKRQTLAAALEGELMAALHICENRAQALNDPGAVDGKYLPRLRTMLYQAHLTEIGLLGPVLARRVASVYGQMSDMGNVLETPAPGRFTSGLVGNTATPSRLNAQKNLEQLARQIRITLNGLAFVERTGLAYAQHQDQPARREPMAGTTDDDRLRHPSPQSVRAKAPSQPSNPPSTPEPPPAPSPSELAHETEEEEEAVSHRDEAEEMDADHHQATSASGEAQDGTDDESSAA